MVEWERGNDLYIPSLPKAPAWLSKGYSLLLLLLLQVSPRWTEFVPSAQIASSLRTSSTLTKAWTILGTSFPRWTPKVDRAVQRSRNES